MNIGLVAAIYITNDEHRRLLKQMVTSIHSSQHELLKIAIINNRLENNDWLWVKENFNIVIINACNCLCRAWNIGIKNALLKSCNYVLVANTDIVFRLDTIDALVDFAQAKPEAYAWCPTFYQHDQGVSVEQVMSFDAGTEVIDDHYFSCFMVDKRLFQDFGKFDEQFAPIYYEDCDMAYRVKLKGGKFISTTSAIVWHYGSATMKTALDIKHPDGDMLANGAYENYNRYVAKWGGAPGEEQWTTPYNDTLPNGGKR